MLLFIYLFCILLFEDLGVVLKKQADLDIARRHMAIRARRAAMQQER